MLGRGTFGFLVGFGVASNILLIAAVIYGSFGEIPGDPGLSLNQATWLADTVVREVGIQAAVLGLMVGIIAGFGRKPSEPPPACAAPQQAVKELGRRD